MDKDDLRILDRLMESYSLAEILGGLESLCMARAEVDAVDLGDTKMAKQWVFHGALLKIFKSGLERK